MCCTSTKSNQKNNSNPIPNEIVDKTKNILFNNTYSKSIYWILLCVLSPFIAILIGVFMVFILPFLFHRMIFGEKIKI